VSNNKKYKKKPATTVAPKQTPKQAELQSQLTPQQLNIVLPVAIAIITFIVYRSVLGNQFLDWDDWIYIEKDPFIKSFTAHNIQMMLFHNITQNYFHPLTMLSLAVNYHFSQLNPEGYYVTNLLIHCGNTVLIFFLTKTLLENMSERYGYGEIQGITWLSALVALIHGVHPMHVESVAWIAERKDVTYSFFYFAGLIAYVRYLKDPKLKSLLLVVFLYGCSLMGKPMAVSFPLSLFAMDFLFKRDKQTISLPPILNSVFVIVKTFLKVSIKLRINILSRFMPLETWAKLIAEKVPVFLVSILGGLLVFITVPKSGSMAFLNGFTLLHKLTVPCYSFLMYFVKAFAPFKLCGYYPYPPVTTDGYLPLFFYLCPLFAAALAILPIYFARKAGENYFRVVGFGMAFYLANVLFILQFLSAGVAIMAERYSYVAYFGVFFMTAYLIGNIIQRFPSYKVPVLTGVAIFVMSLAYICDGRTKVWHNSETFWHDIIEKYPRQWMVPYMNLGQYYVDHGQMDSAFTNYSTLVELHSTTPEVYRNLANIYGMRKQYDKSIELYALALKYDTSGAGDIYLDRAVTYSMMGKLDLALPDYDKAYAKDTTSEKILSNRSYAYLSLNQFDSALRDYNHLIRMNPSEPTYYLRRGSAELNKASVTGDGALLTKSLEDYNKCLSMQPKNGECMYDMSIGYKLMKDFNSALSYAIRARQAGFQVTDSYISELQKGAGASK